MKERSLWEFITRRLKSGREVVLLVVAASTGSSPGRPGFKMAVDSEGQLSGSIGGGIMEVKLVELAKERLRKGYTAPLVRRQIHNKSAPRHQSGMICSGEQTVVLFPVLKKHLPAVRRLLRCLKNHLPARVQISPDEIRVLENKTVDFEVRFTAKSGSGFRYEEQEGPVNQLCIIGGGHCALALSEMMSKMDFYIRLYDDRPGLNSLVKNRFVQEKRVVNSYSDIGACLPVGDKVYVVVMTLGYRSDETVLRQLLDKPFKYLGVLGSAAKMKTLLENLRSEGFPPEQLDRIHTPIGLPINSRTPEEIAVSIAAEIIAVKNDK